MEARKRRVFGAQETRRYATGIVTIAAIVLLIAGTVWFSRSRPALENAGGKAAPVDIALVKTGHPERRNFTLCCRWFGRVESKRVMKVNAPEAGQVVSTEAQDGAITKKVDLRIVATLSPPADIPLEGRTAIIYSTKGETIPGIVVKVIPQRTLTGVTFVWTIWIEGDAINRQMKLGETVSGEIPLLVRNKVFALPAEAIVRDEQEQPLVFLNVAGGYRKQLVKTGLTSAGWVEVVSGIPEGAEVVVQGAYELFYKDFSKIYKVAD
jgi:multidrug efflux pump subunit AcrA (membrane-fusion protein)